MVAEKKPSGGLGVLQEDEQCWWQVPPVAVMVPLVQVRSWRRCRGYVPSLALARTLVLVLARRYGFQEWRDQGWKG